MSLFEAFFLPANALSDYKDICENKFTIAPKLTFKKEEKLKSRKVIEQLFKSGKIFSISPFKIIYIITRADWYILQSGFGASAKRFKKAVDRNRVKRLMREVYRLQKNRLKEVLKNNNKSMAVFFIYTGNTIGEYDEIFKAMRASLRKLEKIADENADENS